MKRGKLTKPVYGQACEGCPLQHKRQFVMFDSPRSAKLAVIGESPGRTEILDRVPFVGESGRLLNGVLEQLGIGRSSLFINNVVQCRAVGLPNTKPTHAVMERCGRINAQLMYQSGVKRVLTLGAIAMNHFMGTSGQSIMKNRGQVFKSRTFQTRDGPVQFEVLPTFHPAAILRRPDGFTEFIEDVTAFFFPEQSAVYKPGDYFIIDDLDRAVATITSWSDSLYISIDLETSGYSPHNDYILCVAMSNTPGQGYVFTQEVVRQKAFWRVIKELNDAGMRWAMHVGFFDHRWIFHKTKIDLNLWLDTMLSSYVLDSRTGGHDLKGLASKHFGFPDWEAEIKKYLKRSTIDSYADIPRRVLYGYAAYDADATTRLADLHLHTLDDRELELVHGFLVPGTVTLGKMSLSGIAIDEEHWHRLQVKYTAIIESAKKFMQNYVGDPNFNPNSPKQVQHYMYDVFNLPTHDKSAKVGHHPKLSSGRTSTLAPRTTAMDQLERLAEGYEQSIWVKALIALRTKRKAVTSYLKAYKPNPKTGRIHPRYLVQGTRTGRLSSRDPNIMNAPHYGYIRELIVAAPGNVLVSVDYSQAELRVLAALAKSQMMADIYRKGGDLHDIVSRQIFGQGYSKRERMIAKAIVFGIIYGRSITNIAETFGLPQAKAVEYYHTFLGRFDGVKEWMERQKEFALDHGYVELPTGRRRMFHLITRSNVAEVQRQAVNTPVQGTASDLMFMSLIELHPIITRAGGNLLFPLHDSIMFELPIGRWKELVDEIVDVMEDVPRRLFGDFLPFAADCDVGWRWGQLVEFKREAKPDGTLVPISETIAGYEVPPEPEDWWQNLVWEANEWEEE